MTHMYGVRGSFVLLRPKKKVKLPTQSADHQICMGNGLYQPGRFYFSGCRKDPNVQIFQGLRLLLTNVIPEKSSKNGQGGGGEKNKY